MNPTKKVQPYYKKSSVASQSTWVKTKEIRHFCFVLEFLQFSDSWRRSIAKEIVRQLFGRNEQCFHIRPINSGNAENIHHRHGKDKNGTWRPRIGHWPTPNSSIEKTNWAARMCAIWMYYSWRWLGQIELPREDNRTGNRCHSDRTDEFRWQKTERRRIECIEKTQIGCSKFDSVTDNGEKTIKSSSHPTGTTTSASSHRIDEWQWKRWCWRWSGWFWGRLWK